MLDYATPFARAGAAAGAGALGSLGRALGPLDYPRQALWNLPGKLAGGDFLGALPGLLGAGAAAGLAATGAGLPLALLGGAAVGGVSQGAGSSVDRGRFDAPAGSDLAAALGADPDSWPGAALAMAASVAGDPLTYAGGAGGARAGGRYGSHLTDVAVTRGPRYPGGLEKLDPLLRSGEADVVERVQALRQSPALARVLGEIPPGSRFLGAGVEATALRTPEGHVVRIAGGPGAGDVARHRFLSAGDAAPAEAPRFQGMIAPARDVPVGEYRVQHSPLLEMLPPGPGPLDAEWSAAQRALRQNARDAGMLPADVHPGNVGRTPAGNFVISDPGAAIPLDADVPAPFAPRQGSALDNALLSLLGSDRALRRGIPADIARGLPAQGIPVPAAAALARERAARDALLAAMKTDPAAPGAGPFAPAPGSGVDLGLAGLATNLGGR